MPELPTYTADEVAALLRCKGPTFLRKWRTLNERHGFPRPLPGCGLVWSRALVDGWILAGGVANAARPANENRGAPPRPEGEGSAAVVARQSASLAARYGSARP